MKKYLLILGAIVIVVIAYFNFFVEEKKDSQTLKEFSTKKLNSINQEIKKKKEAETLKRIEKRQELEKAKIKADAIIEKMNNLIEKNNIQIPKREPSRNEKSNQEEINKKILRIKKKLEEMKNGN